MELIIKPLEACQFSCSYCSSPQIAPEDDKGVVLDLEQIFAFLKRFPNTRTIIVNGGEPLLLKPAYYQKIMDHKDANGYDFILSFTTNLEVFHKNPEPWLPLFKRDDVGVCTSFEYGGLRTKGDGSLYDEEAFLQVLVHFHEHVGYTPDFISVVTKENYDQAIDNVRLAKSIGVECKLNYVVGSGRQEETLVLADIYAKYLEIEEQGLAGWEYNTQQMLRRLEEPATTSCPQHRTCDESIRALNPGGDYYSCGALSDDKTHAIDFDKEMIATDRAKPLQKDIMLMAMHDECFICPMFDICNGCRKTIKDHKKSDLVEEHCMKMKAQADRIINLNKKYRTKRFLDMNYRSRVGTE